MVRPFSWAAPCSGEGWGSPEGDARVDAESSTLFLLETLLWAWAGPGAQLSLMFPSKVVLGLQDTLCWNILAAARAPSSFQRFGAHLAVCGRQEMVLPGQLQRSP